MVVNLMREVGGMGRGLRGSVCLLVAALLVFIGCATIISGGGAQKIPITTNPAGTRVRIIDLVHGQEVYSSQAPCTAKLRRGFSYMEKGKYKIVFEKEGYESKEVLVTGRINGWYIGGNLLIGGLIGWLIVDPLTGAMWTLEPKDITETLSGGSSLLRQRRGLMVVLKSEVPDLPEGLEQRMKPVPMF